MLYMSATAALPDAEGLVNIIIKSSLILMCLSVNCQSLFTLIVSLFCLVLCPSITHSSLSYLFSTSCLFFVLSFLTFFISLHFLFHLGVPGKPVITGFEDPVQDGGSVTLTCTSTGSKPPAQLYWYKGQEKLEGTHIYLLTYTPTYLHRKTNTFSWSALATVATCLIQNIAIQNITICGSSMALHKILDYCLEVHDFKSQHCKSTTTGPSSKTSILPSNQP